MATPNYHPRPMTIKAGLQKMPHADDKYYPQNSHAVSVSKIARADGKDRGKRVARGIRFDREAV